MSIYTKKGDKGETSLYGSDKRFSKTDLIFSVIGTIDEANSHLGLAAALVNPKLLHKKIFENKIEQVQKTLFVLGSIFAGAKVSIPSSLVKKYEREMDSWLKVIPKRRNFILPGGSVSSAELFIARSVVRRLEREAVAFSKNQRIKPSVLIYINRLSSYLYVLARYLNFQKKIEEIVWKQ